MVNSEYDKYLLRVFRKCCAENTPREMGLVLFLSREYPTSYITCGMEVGLLSLYLLGLALCDSGSSIK